MAHDDPPSTSSTTCRRFQVPGEQYVNTGRTYEKDGFIPRWRAIRDDKGRIMVAICFNMHLGDAWEWADDPRYPENFASARFSPRNRLHHVWDDPLVRLFLPPIRSWSSR